jgi:dihydropyrimidinase
MVTQLSVGREDELQTLIEMGIPSFKVYTTYRPNYYMDDATLFRLMKKAGEIGGLVIVHAENDAIVSEATRHLVNSGQAQWRYHAQGRPAVAEQEAVHRVIFLARHANAPVYIVHCTTSHSVELVRQARTQETSAWCETCPQYLLLDERVYEGDHPEYYILQPPLRAKEEPAKLWSLIQEGAVSVISTDTCDYTLAQKREFQEFTRTPGGLPGIETLLPLIYTYGVETGRLQLTDVARLLCENPSRLFGIDQRKGFIRPGADADIVLYNPKPETMLNQKSTHYLAGYSPYEGMRIRGEVQLTISRGDIIYEQGKITDATRRGKFVPGEPFSINADDL